MAMLHYAGMWPCFTMRGCGHASLRGGVAMLHYAGMWPCFTMWGCGHASLCGGVAMFHYVESYKIKSK